MPFRCRELVDDQERQRILSNQFLVTELAEWTRWLPNRVAGPDATEVGCIAGTFVLVAAPAQCLQVGGIVCSTLALRKNVINIKRRSSCGTPQSSQRPAARLKML